jgi:hypothetical protein
MTRPLDIAEIVGLLADRAEALCLDLLPNGRKEGTEWRVGSVAGEPGRSMGVHLAGAKAGIWCDWAGRSDDRGDALDLVAKVKFAGDKRRALFWSRAWLGLDNVDPAAFAEQRRQVEVKKRQAKRDEERTRNFAFHLFLSSIEDLRGTLGADYLEGRGINFARLGRQPRSLRYHPQLVHPETGELVPGLVAAITASDGTFLAAHRTFLERLPDGRVVKRRDLDDAKWSLGRYAGGLIRLWRGATGKPWKDAERGEWVIIGEGIEDTATAVMARPDYRAAAAVSIGNMKGMVLPDAIEGVILLAQNDTEPQALAARQAVIEQLREQGKRVRVALPPAGVKDVNDMVRGFA